MNAAKPGNNYLQSRFDSYVLVDISVLAFILSPFFKVTLWPLIDQISALIWPLILAQGYINKRDSHSAAF